VGYQWATAPPRKTGFFGTGSAVYRFSSSALFTRADLDGYIGDLMTRWKSYGRYEIAILRIAAPPRPTELKTWNRCAEILDRYFARPAKSAARVEVWDDRPARIPLGRMSWSAESFGKWAEPKKAPRGRHFIFFDAVVPSWPQCIKRGLPPDVYFKMTRMLKKQAWSYAMVLAVRDGADLPSAIPTARELAAVIDAVSLHRVVGPFAEPGAKRGQGSEGMTNALVDWSSEAPSAKTWKSRKVRL
jgi:hypothetical protein